MRNGDTDGGGTVVWLSINEVAKRSGVLRGAVERWIRTGVLVYGRRVKLGAVRVGGRFKVTPDVLAAFHAACNPEGVPAMPESPAALAARGKRDQEAAARLLSGKGR